MCHPHFSAVPASQNSFSLCGLAYSSGPAPTLITRTQSLNRALTFLHSPFTPAVLRAAVPAAVNIIERTTEYGSEQRFSQLSALLGDGVIGSVWMYSSEDVDTVGASVDVLPIVVRALGVGSTRYLKVSTNTLRVCSKID